MHHRVHQPGSSSPLAAVKPEWGGGAGAVGAGEVSKAWTGQCWRNHHMTTKGEGRCLLEGVRNQQQGMQCPQVPAGARLGGRAQKTGCGSWLGFPGPFLTAASWPARPVAQEPITQEVGYFIHYFVCSHDTGCKSISPWDIFSLHVLAEMGRGNAVCLAEIWTVQMIFNYLIGFDRSKVRKQFARWAVTSEACSFGRR